MENKVLKMVFFILLLISLSIGENSDLPIRYDEPYAKGVNAYYNDEWLQVIENMNHAVRDYKEISKAREKCFDECRDQAVDIPPNYTEDNELHFYHGVVQRATCIQKCKGKSHDDEVSSSYKMEQNLELGEVYNYIQISLFKVSILHRYNRFHIEPLIKNTLKLFFLQVFLPNLMWLTGKLE